MGRSRRVSGALAAELDPIVPPGEPPLPPGQPPVPPAGPSVARSAHGGPCLLVSEIQEGDIVGRAGTGVDIYVMEPAEVYLVDAAGARFGDAPGRECDGAGEHCEGFELNFLDADNEFVPADDECVYAQIQSAGVIDYAIVPFADAFVVIFPASETGASGTFMYDLRTIVLPATEG